MSIALAGSSRIARALTAAGIVLMLGGCGLPDDLRCRFTDIPAGLSSPVAAKRGAAAECAMRAEPARIAQWVPVLTPLLGDTTIFREFESSGGIVGFGEAGLKQINVAMPALRALERATPMRQNIAPIVEALILAANRTRPGRMGASLYGEPESVVYSLVALLSTRYHAAGLRDEVSKTIQAATPRLLNVAFWSNADFNRQYSDLYDGRTPYPWDGSQAPRQVVSRMPAGVEPSVGAVGTVARGSGRGMTWGRLKVDGIPRRWTYLACDGAPGLPMTHPREGNSCDPYTGDTACKETLPVLCRHAVAPDAFQAAVKGTTAPLQDRVLSLEYAATPGISGTALSSADAADKLCAARFGEGWRMAEHHDHFKGWGAIGRDAGVPPDSRFWVAINDQPGNCWNR